MLVAASWAIGAVKIPYEASGRKVNPASVAIEAAIVEAISMIEVRVPSKVERNEHGWIVRPLKFPAAIRRADINVSGPRRIDDILVKYHGLTLVMDFNSHDLVRSVTFDLKLRMRIA
jgi:hypothetical protein